MILRTMATTRLWTLSALLAAVLSPGSASAAEQVARLETSRAEHPLARLQFKNLGMVRADMQFQEKRQPCYYVESPTAWSVPWGSGRVGRATRICGSSIGRPPAAVAAPLARDWRRLRWACAWRCRWEAWGRAPSSCGRMAACAIGTSSTTRRAEAAGKSSWRIACWGSASVLRQAQPGRGPCGPIHPTGCRACCRSTIPVRFRFRGSAYVIRNCR